jgi:hypothetical protein
MSANAKSNSFDQSMGHLPARLSVLNKLHIDLRYATFLKKRNLSDRNTGGENSLSEFCSKLLLLAART